MARYVALVLPSGPVAPGEPASPDTSGDPAVALLGSKGAGLVRMCRLGLPVPPGLVLTTELWQKVYGQTAGPGVVTAARSGPVRATTDGGAATTIADELWEEVWAEVQAALTLVQEAAGGARLGDPDNPLLLAVRSGSMVSMPGMMTSVCNLGLSDVTVEGLARRLGDRRCALDCYRRFLHCYGTVVLGLQPAGMFDSDPLDALLYEYKQRRGLLSEADFGEDDLVALCAAYKAEIRRRLGAEAVPDDPHRQLRAAVTAVLHSWNRPRAREYRQLHGISDALGTAVTIQAMVFGNLGGNLGGSTGRITSAAGVAFTRDPSSGEPSLYGEFLPAAQGEDVVSGGYTPRPISELETALPAAYRSLVEVARTLEQHLGDMQDIEFTIEREKLWLLQTRTGKRSGRAMLKIACDLHREGKLSVEQALLRMDAPRLSELLHPTVDRQAPRILLGRGLPASPGAATGRLVMSSAAAAELRSRGEAAILARVETSSDDIVGIQAAAGVLTARGGMTSHAAVVARGMGRTAVVGASALQIDYAGQELRTREHVVRIGELVTVDGNSGEVLLGAVPLRAAHLYNNPDYGELMTWADGHAALRVLAEADTPVQAQLCRDLGLRGIGLARSERLLCHPERAATLRAVCEQPKSLAACSRLADSLTPSYRELLLAAPPGEAMLRLLDPAGTQALLGAADCELTERERRLFARAIGHPGTESTGGSDGLRAIWRAQLLAIARAQQGGPAAARPLVLIPSSVAPADAVAVKELAQAARAAHPGAALPLGALLSSPEAVESCAALLPHLDVLGFACGELLASGPEANGAPVPRASRGNDGQGAGSPDGTAPSPGLSLEREKGRSALLSRTTNVAPGRADGVAALAAAIARARAAAGSPTLRLGLYSLDNLSSDEHAVASAARLGLDFVVCTPLRAPIARLIAAQVRLRDRPSSDS